MSGNASEGSLPGNIIVQSREAAQMASLWVGFTIALEQHEKAKAAHHRDPEKIRQWDKSCNAWANAGRSIGRTYMVLGLEAILTQCVMDPSMCIDPEAFMKKAESITEEQVSSFAEAARLAVKVDKAKTDALEKRIKARDTKVNDLEKRISSRTLLLEIKDKTVIHLEGKIKGKETTIQDLEKRISSMTLLLETKDKTINHLEGKIKGKETTIHHLENKIKNMDAMDRTHGSDTENGVEDLRRKIKSRTQDLQVATDTIDLLEGMVDVYARQAIEFIGHTIKAAPGPEHGWSFVMCNDGLIYLPSPTAQALTSMLNELLSPSNLRLLPFKPLLEAANLSDLRQNQPIVKCHMAEDGSVKPQQGSLDDAFKPFRDSWMEQEKFDIEKGRASVIKIGALFKIAQRRAEIRTDVDVDNTFLPVMLANEQEIASMVRQTTFEEVVRLLEIGDTVFPGSSKHRKHVRNDVPNQEIKRKKRRFSNS